MTLLRSGPFWLGPDDESCSIFALSSVISRFFSSVSWKCTDFFKVFKGEGVFCNSEVNEETYSCKFDIWLVSWFFSKVEFFFSSSFYLEISINLFSRLFIFWDSSWSSVAFFSSLEALCLKWLAGNEGVGGSWKTWAGFSLFCYSYNSLISFSRAEMVCSFWVMILSNFLIYLFLFRSYCDSSSSLSFFPLLVSLIMSSINFNWLKISLV